MFKNMKIAITPDQPLDGVMEELKRLGYRVDVYKPESCFVYAYDNGTFDCFKFNHEYDWFAKKTLDQLKEMK